LQRAVVGSAVDGRVIELAAQEGDAVTNGQPLVKLLTETIELELEAAEAELELRRQELAELEHGSRPEEIEQAKAKMLSAAARMEFARGSRERYQSLEDERGVVSVDDLAQVVAAAKQDEQLYYEAKAAYELAVKGPRAERIAQARAQVAMQQALVSQIQDQLNKHTIVAGFDGYVLAERTEVGQWVKKGDPVMEVAALKEVEIQAYVVEEHVPHVALGMTVRVEVPALPDRAFLGTVSAIVPQADIRARTFPVKIRVPNVLREDGPLLKSGMYARVTLPIGLTQQAVMVPKDALVLGGPRPLVFVVQSGTDQRGTVHPVAVDLGVATRNLIQVKGEIRPAQLVVVEGNER
ncbi:MAG: efflux transporter periplasmic adaptor subunit, partial [Planctomycetes bacterium RBG_16_64_10]